MNEAAGILSAENVQLLRVIVLFKMIRLSSVVNFFPRSISSFHSMHWPSSMVSYGSFFPPKLPACGVTGSSAVSVDAHSGDAAREACNSGQDVGWELSA